MTGNSVLLDTSVVVHHFRKSNAALESHLSSGGKIFIPLVVLGELLAGAYHGSRQEKMLQQIDIFLRSAALLVPDETTAHNYGMIYAELYRAGTPIPQNDIWVAAYAREHGLAVAVRDGHFTKISNLTILEW